MNFIFNTACILIIIGVLVFLGYQKGTCDERGGVFARNLWGSWECITAEDFKK